MIAIVSPKPRHAALVAPPSLDRPIQLQSPPIYPSTDMHRSTGLFSPPRLLSPITLPGTPIHKSNLSKASASCSPTKRRRTHTTASRTSRRRHCLRSDCVVNYNHQVFDQLPWISQIESEPPSTLDLWDIADLSLLPDPPSSGVGPVRNRRSFATLRSGVNPFGGSLAGEAQPAGSITSQQQQPLRSRPSPLHLQLLPAVDRQVLDPRTPPPSMTFNPMEVAFQGLMPAFPPNDPPPFAAPAPLPM